MGGLTGGVQEGVSLHSSGRAVRGVIEFDEEQGADGVGIGEDEVDVFGLDAVEVGLALVGVFGDVEEVGEADLGEDLVLVLCGLLEDAEE